MKMSFSDAVKASESGTSAVEEVPVAVGETPTASTAVVERPSAPLSSYVEGEDAEGEFTKRDMKWPRLNLVQKTGEQADSFDPNSWTISKELVIGKGTEPLRIVALKIQKLYQEQLPYGSKVQPKIFRTAAEVEDAGLSLEWGAVNRAAEILNTLLWIPQPKEIDAPHIFVMDGPEGPGAIVGYTAARTAYGSVGKGLINAHGTFLRKDKGGLVAGWWNLVTTLEKREGNSWYLPRIKPDGATSPELQTYLRSIVG